MISHIEALVNTHCTDDIWKLHTAKMAEYGFDRVIYGFTRFWTEEFVGAPEDIMFLSNLPDSFTLPFMYEGYYLRAPMAKWANSNVGACSWGAVRHDPEKLTPEEIEVIEFCNNAAVTAGYTIAFRCQLTRERAAQSLIAAEGLTQDEVDEIWERHGREISLFSNIFHFRVISMPHSYGRARLTKRQREVLEWVGEGKTAQDIATIVGLTPVTVEKHLRLARQALDVETTTQAVLKASLQNQIYVNKS